MIRVNLLEHFITKEMGLFAYIASVLLASVPYVLGIGQSCQDADFAACVAMQRQNPSMCSDPILGHSVCPNLCNSCPLTCYSCNIFQDDTSVCNTVTCADDQACMTKEMMTTGGSTHSYVLKCEKISVCDGHRRRSLNHRSVYIDCCTKDLCNRPSIMTTVTPTAVIPTTTAPTTEQSTLTAHNTVKQTPMPATVTTPTTLRPATTAPVPTQPTTTAPTTKQTTTTAPTTKQTTTTAPTTKQTTTTEQTTTRPTPTSLTAQRTTTKPATTATATAPNTTPTITKPVTTHVHLPGPEIAAKIVNIVVMGTWEIKGTVVLKCVTSGNPKPLVHWSVDQSKNAVKTIDGDSSILVVGPIMFPESLLYTCETSNKLGGTRQTYFGRIQVPDFVG